MAVEAAQAKRHYTFEEYLRLEQQDGIRYEYFNGEVFAMAGGSMNHSDIANNITNHLKRAFAEKGCRAFQEGVKVDLGKGRSYVYPDVVLTCSEDDLEDGYIIRNPLLVVEVLSPSTETHDRRTKWNLYRRLPSLKYFLFISQEQPFVELYSRSHPTALYTYQAFDSMEEIIRFPEMDFSLSMQQVYQYVRFAKKEEKDII